jgi:thymidylate kinase
MRRHSDQPGRRAWVALVGPHGCGKTSVLRALTHTGGPVAVFYRYPAVISNPRGPAGSLRASVVRPAHPGWVSVAKLLARAAEWLAGCWLKIAPAARRGARVVFDRHYFWDVVADPGRYRYGGPPGLAEWLARHLPGPNLMVLLDAPVEVLARRKPEETGEALARLRAAYRQLASGQPGWAVVDTSQPLEDVLAEVKRLIADVEAPAGRRAQA